MPSIPAPSTASPATPRISGTSWPHTYQFQFNRAACKQAGWTGPLHRCSVYGDKQVGQRFNAMLEMGQSSPGLTR